MASIEVSKLKQKQKGYVKSLFTYEFNSLLHLIFELFTNYTHGQKEIIEIERLLDEIGYKNLKDIPADEIETIKKYIRLQLPAWEHQEDAELLTYKLLAAIQSKNIVVIVDDKIIEDLEKPISLAPDSTITFINTFKIDSISFTTL